MVHDMVESLGHHHWIGTFLAEDEELKSQDIGRIGDIYIAQDAFKGLEKWMYKTLESIPEEKRERISTTELLFDPTDGTPLLADQNDEALEAKRVALREAHRDFTAELQPIAPNQAAAEEKNTELLESLRALGYIE